MNVFVDSVGELMSIIFVCYLHKMYKNYFGWFLILEEQESKIVLNFSKHFLKNVRKELLISSYKFELASIKRKRGKVKRERNVRWSREKKVKTVSPVTFLSEGERARIEKR